MFAKIILTPEFSMSRTYLATLILCVVVSIAPGQETLQPASEVQSAVEGIKPTIVKPGINAGFLDPNLDVQEWIDRFEVESREVFHARAEIMRQLDLQPGQRIADVGAGTGFFTLLMAEAIGDKGWAYAIDISPRFVEHLVKQFDGRSVSNVTTVMCDDDSICLPPASINVAFICDVYHHFEYPNETMKSIHSALTEGGRVVLIDFERIPGVSREWTIGHVRAGKQTFSDEIQAAGFELTGERKIPGFKENYYLEFRKQ